MVTLYRVNSYQTFQIPPKPSFEVRVNYSQILPQRKRATNLQKLLQATEAQSQHFIEKIQFSPD